MKVTIYPDHCKGCGLCEGIAPSVFRVDDYNQAQVVIQPDPLTPGTGGDRTLPHGRYRPAGGIECYDRENSNQEGL